MNTRDQIKKLAAEGYSINQMSRILNKSPTRIVALLRELQIKLTRYKNKDIVFTSTYDFNTIYKTKIKELQSSTIHSILRSKNFYIQDDAAYEILKELTLNDVEKKRYDKEISEKTMFIVVKKINDTYKFFKIEFLC